MVFHPRTLSFRRVGDVLDVDCLTERLSITTVLAVQPFCCVGADPVWIAFPLFGSSSNVDSTARQVHLHYMNTYEKEMRTNNQQE
jgi:hypothetical protein